MRQVLLPLLLAILTALPAGAFATDAPVAAEVPIAEGAAPAAELKDDPIDTSLKRFNPRWMPLAAFLGNFSVDLDIALNERFTAGPAFSYIRTFSMLEGVLGVHNGFAIGAKGSFSITAPRFNDGWYASPSLTYVRTQYAPNALLSESESVFSSLLVAAELGYQWFLTSEFNLSFGVAAGYYTTAPRDSPLLGSRQGLVISLGYAL